MQNKLIEFRELFSRALKDQGYESDTTLIFRRKEQSTLGALSPVEQKQAYLNVQSGGEVPLQGFQKAAPEKPKGKRNQSIFGFKIAKIRF